MKQHTSYRLPLAIALFVSALLTGFSAFAQTLPSASKAPLCPKSFYTVLIISDARQCQYFDVSLPASLIYFTPQPPKDVIRFYQTNDASLIAHTQGKERTLLLAKNDSVRIVVSPDHQGTQVDILVTSTH